MKALQPAEKKESTPQQRAALLTKVVARQFNGDAGQALYSLAARYEFNGGDLDAWITSLRSGHTF